MPPRKRQRDYKAEYARRKQLHKGDIVKARGHKNKTWERMQRAVKKMEAGKAPWEQFSARDVYAIADEYGPDVVFEALELRKRAEDAYSYGRLDEAQAIWRERNPDLPDWLYHYHGFFT